MLGAAGPALLFLVWRLVRVKHVAPMVVIQIPFGIALGPPLLAGRLAS